LPPLPLTPPPPSPLPFGVRGKLPYPPLTPKGTGGKATWTGVKGKESHYKGVGEGRQHPCPKGWGGGVATPLWGGGGVRGREG